MLSESSLIQNQTYILMDKVQALLSSGNVNEGMNQIIKGMNTIRKSYNIQEWREFTQNSFLNHPLVDFIHQCPFTYHSFIKPRGYAGDAELLDFIYGLKLPSENSTTLGIKIFGNRYNTKVSRSVRERRDILAQTIDLLVLESSHPVEILSVACGHLREAEKSMGIKEGNISKLIAFDQDYLSLELIKQELNYNFIQTIQGSVTALIRQKETFSNLDLVYAAGLYDYLSQPFATKLTKIMFEMLQSGGKLLVANFVPDHPEIGYMETFMDWHLIYRTEQELIDVIKDIAEEKIAYKRTFFDKNCNIVFLELTKA